VNAGNVRFVHNFNRTIFVLATAFGILGGPWLAYEVTGDWRWSAVTSAVCFALIGVALYRDYIAIPVFFSKFGTRKYSGNFYVVQKKEQIKIASDYSAVVKTEKKFGVTGQTMPSDFVDLIEVHENKNVDETIYRIGSASRITRIERRQENTVAIFWQPVKPIRPGSTFTHKYEYDCISDMLYGPGAFWQGYMVDVLTERCVWNFALAHPIKRCYAFTYPDDVKDMDWRTIIYYGEDRHMRNCQQPVLSQDRKTLTWDLRQPKVHSRLVLVGVYDDGEAFLQRMRDK
jgi:hypothetical protein